MDQGEQVNSIKVSVIIPVYNTGAYVEEAVRSIMNQTLREIEIIVIDDGSTDNSLSVIEKLAREDNRIHYLSQVNQGQSVARNVGIETAAGAYVYFMDSDDLLNDSALEQCYLKSEELKTDFILFNSQVLNKENEFGISYDYQAPTLDEARVYSGQEMLSLLLKEKTYRCSPCIHFTRLETIQQFTIRYFPGIIHEDELFSALLYLQSSRAGYIKKAFFQRRYRENSVMTKRYSMRNVTSYLVVAEQLILFSRAKGNELVWLIDRLISYILDPNIYKANRFSLKDRVSIFTRCLNKRCLRYLSLKTILVLLFPFTIKLKGWLKKIVP
jgi:glycosyltransferase involved in cell wall biosynthesis